MLPINDESSYRVWVLWRFFDKRFLPFSGGFLEQPEWLLDDLMNIEAMYSRVSELI